jgi:solute carrier family 35 protein E1
MPHSTRPSATQTQIPSSFKFNGDSQSQVQARASMEKFPELNVNMNSLDGQSQFYASPVSANINGNGGLPSVDRWQARRDSRLRGASWGVSSQTNGSGNGHGHSGLKGHSRQKSLGDALRTIRTRKGSVSANVHEIGDALKAPVSPKLIVRFPLSQPSMIYSTQTSPSPDNK